MLLELFVVGLCCAVLGAVVDVGWHFVIVLCFWWSCMLRKVLEMVTINRFFMLMYVSAITGERLRRRLPPAPRLLTTRSSRTFLTSFAYSKSSLNWTPHSQHLILWDTVKSKVASNSSFQKCMFIQVLLPIIRIQFIALYDLYKMYFYVTSYYFENEIYLTVKYRLFWFKYLF